LIRPTIKNQLFASFIYKNWVVLRV